MIKSILLNIEKSKFQQQESSSVVSLLKHGKLRQSPVAKHSSSNLVSKAGEIVNVLQSKDLNIIDERQSGTYNLIDEEQHNELETLIRNENEQQETQQTDSRASSMLPDTNDQKTLDYNSLRIEKSESNHVTSVEESALHPGVFQHKANHMHNLNSSFMCNHYTNKHQQYETDHKPLNLSSGDSYNVLNSLNFDNINDFDECSGRISTQRRVLRNVRIPDRNHKTNFTQSKFDTSKLKLDLTRILFKNNS